MAPVLNPRWTRVLGYLTHALSAGPRSVVVDGHAYASWFADLLADALGGAGVQCLRLGDEPTAASSAASAAAFSEDDRAWNRDAIVLAAGPGWRTARDGWDVQIWLRTARVEGLENAEHQAQIVVDLHDPEWPVLRRLDEALGDRDSWFLTETRAFFAAKAATWDTRFGDDMPAYAAAVVDSDVPLGGVAIDVGCGTGRALPALREAVGAEGTVLGLDVTLEMLETALTLGRSEHGQLGVADARRLPLVGSSVDAVFAAGLIGHLSEVEPVLAELARVTRTGGRLTLFHPSGRVALAARHGRTLKPDEPLAESQLRPLLTRTGWSLERYDDADHRFFARALRQGVPSHHRD